MSEMYQFTHNKRGNQEQEAEDLQDMMSDRESDQNEGEQYFEGEEIEAEFSTIHQLHSNEQVSQLEMKDRSKQVKNTEAMKYSQNNNAPPLHPTHPSQQNSFYNNLEKTMSMNTNYQIRTPLINNSFRVSQKTKANQDEVLTQGKSSKSLKEQFNDKSSQEESMNYRTHEQLKKQRSQNDQYESQNEDQSTRVIFDNNNLFFIVGEIYKKIESDELFKTLKTDDTSREYLHYRVQEIIQDSYVRYLVSTLKEMQVSLNNQVEENIKLQEVILMQEDKQQYYNDSLNSYQSKCASLEALITEIQGKDEERNKEIRQLYVDRNNSEKNLMEKYELLQEQNSKLDKKNSELQIQLQQMNEKHSEFGGLKGNYQDSIVQNQVMKKDMEKLQLDIMQREQEIQKLQTKLQDANEKYQKEMDDINTFYEKELKQMKSQRKKEKEMYEKILHEKNNLELVQNSNQSNIQEQMNNQITEFQRKITEYENEISLMKQEYSNLQARMQDQQEIQRSTIDSLKVIHRGEIADMKKIQEKVEQINTDLQKDYSLLKQSKQMNETNQNEKFSLEKQLLNDQILKMQHELQSIKLQKESFGKEIIDVTQLLEKEKNENSKLLYKIQMLSDRDHQDSNQLRKKMDELEETIRRRQKEMDQIIQEKEKSKMEIKEKDDDIRQMKADHTEILKRLQKATQRFEEVDKRQADIIEEKNNLYRLLDSKGKEMKRLEEEVQILQKKTLEKENTLIISDSKVQQLNQQIKLISEQKDSKSQELKNVSKEVRNVQKEMEICREMNLQNQHQLLQHEEEEKRLKEIDAQQKDLIMQLSSRIEQLEFELLHIREDYEHKESIFKEHYELQIEKLHIKLSEGLANHLQMYQNQSNSQLISLLKDNQLEIQEQESLVNQQYSEITHLKSMNEQLNKKLLELIQLKKKNYSPSQYEAVIRENQQLRESNKSLRILKNNEDSNKKSMQQQPPIQEESISVQQHYSYNSTISPRASEIEQSKKSSEQTSPQINASILTIPRQATRKVNPNNNEDKLEGVLKRLEDTQTHYILTIQNLNRDHHQQSDEIKQQYSRMKNGQAQDKKTYNILKQQFNQKLVDLRQVLYGEIKDSLIDYRNELNEIRGYAENHRVFSVEVISNLNKQLSYIEQIGNKTDSSTNHSPYQNRSNNNEDQGTPIISQYNQQNQSINLQKLSPQHSSSSSSSVHNQHKHNSMKQDKYLKQFSIEEENSSLSDSNYQGSSTLGVQQQSNTIQSSISSNPQLQNTYKKKINF